jgi:hypothetical protein
MPGGQRWVLSLHGKVDAAIVGSALLDAIGKGEDDPATAGAEFVRWIRGAE